MPQKATCHRVLLLFALLQLSLNSNSPVSFARATPVPHHEELSLKLPNSVSKRSSNNPNTNPDSISDKEFSLREFYSIKRALTKHNNHSTPSSTTIPEKTRNYRISTLRRARKETAALAKLLPKIPVFYGQDHYEQTKPTDGSDEVQWTHVGRPDEMVYNLFFRAPLLLNGTFMETGAGNGIRDSNTLFFEEQLGWSGLLVEGSTENFLALFADGRRKRSVKTYAAVCERRGMTKFVGDGQAAGAVEDMTRHHVESWGRHFKSLEVYDVPCERMDRMVERAGLGRVIDFWSVDLEGGEWRALSTFDWSRHKVRVIAVEMGVGCFMKKRNRCAALLRDRGFCRVAKRAVNEFWTSDHMFKSAYCDSS